MMMMMEKRISWSLTRPWAMLDLVKELEREEIVMGPWEERNHYWVPHIPGAVDQEERRRWNTWWKLEI